MSERNAPKVTRYYRSTLYNLSKGNFIFYSLTNIFLRISIILLITLH